MRSALSPVALAVFVLILALPALADFPPVELVAVRSPVAAGANGLVTIQTKPNTSCAIAVVYKSGPSKAQGLEPQAADAQGRITWTWKVGNTDYTRTVADSSRVRQGPDYASSDDV